MEPDRTEVLRNLTKAYIHKKLAQVEIESTRAVEERKKVLKDTLEKAIAQITDVFAEKVESLDMQLQQVLQSVGNRRGLLDAGDAEGEKFVDRMSSVDYQQRVDEHLNLQTWFSDEETLLRKIGCIRKDVISLGSTTVEYVYGFPWQSRKLCAFNINTQLNIEYSLNLCCNTVYPAIVELDHCRLFICGIDQKQTQAYVFNLHTLQLSETTNMPTARTNLAVIRHGRGVYVLGGTQGTKKENCVTANELYIPGEDAWEIQADLPESNSWVTAVSAVS